MKKQLFIFMLIFIIIGTIGCSQKRSQPLSPEISENTNTPVFTSTETSTMTTASTATQTGTNTPVATNTFTPVDTSTETGTNTPVNTETDTPVYTSTVTLTETATYTPIDTITFTETETFSITDTPTETETPTDTATAGDTPTQTPTSTDNVTGTLILPDVQNGKSYRIYFDNDTNTANGYAADIIGVCGSSINVPYSVTVADGTYYVLAGVDVDDSGTNQMTYGVDYIGIYGSVFPAIPGAPNAVVSGNTVIDVTLSGASAGTTNVFFAGASVTQMRMYIGMEMIMTTANVTLKENDANGNSLTGATVTFGGQTLAEDSPGSGSYTYSGMGYVFTPGSSSTLSVVSTSGNISQDFDIPSNITVTSPSDNATLTTPIQTVDWTYSGGAPGSLMLIFYNNADSSTMINQETLTGSTTTFDLNTSSLVSGAHTLILSAFSIAPITDAAVGSYPFSVTNSYMVPVTAP